MIKVNLHGKLGKDLGESWELEVSSVAEALRAIEANTGKLRKWVLDNKDDIEYEILIDRENLFSEQPKCETIQDIKDSELFLDISDKIKTIDISPMIIGAGFFGNLWRGVTKIFVGAAMIAGAIFLPVIAPVLAFAAPMLAVAGIGLISAGVSSLLAKPPSNIPFTAQQADPIEGNAGGPSSYLFNGPSNTVGEGAPVPVGYGELIIGGHNIMSNYSFNLRAAKTNYDNTTNQVSLYGAESYLFNSRGFLISQKPSYLEI